MTNVVSFPGTESAETTPEATLLEWMNTVAERVEGASLDQAVIILLDENGEQVIYSKNDMRKDQYVGILYIAIQQGLFDGVGL